MKRCFWGICLDLCARFSQKSVAISVDLALWWATGWMGFTVVNVLRIATIMKKVAQSYFFFFAFLDKNQRQIVDF
jgi:hypothetical protein